jgi:hypothetical protein
MPPLSTGVNKRSKNGAGGGSRTHTALRPTDFLATTAFAALSGRSGARRQGLGSGLSLHPPPELPGLRCCPSSLYTFLRQEAWLGIAIQKVSPTLSSSASPVSRRALKFCLSPPRLPFRHAGSGWHLQLCIIEQATGICTSVRGVGTPDYFWFSVGCCFFFGLGFMTLMADASRFVLMCAA